MWKTDFKVCFCSPTRWSWCSMILLCLFTQTLRCALVALRSRLVFLSNGRIVQSSKVKRKYLCIQLLGVSTSESMIPRPYFQALKHRLLSFCLMFSCCHFYFRLQLPLIIIHITCISLSLRRTNAPIHLTSVLGVLGTQETSCILIAGLLERDMYDLCLREFDKPWVIMWPLPP